ncbi:MAG TPA: hypothetical protein VJO16_04855 [Candidatus Acidoferrum sp.]|nr:hypothetical protein [Candidatus Acidoferrum sp.]
MNSSPKRSASVTVAAIVAILSGLILLLGCSAAFFVFLFAKLPGPVSELPPAMRYMMLGTQGFIICLSIFGIVTGIGLLFLRKWARVSVLIWGGLFVFFGVIGMLFIFLMPFPLDPNAPGFPPEAMPGFRLILLVVYGPPLAIGAWWLILFNRKGIKAEFAGSAPPTDPNVPPKPACPLPISVLAWFYITSILNLLFLPFFPSHVPVLVFGQVLPSTLGWTVLILSFLAVFVAGVGLLKLKPWSYDLTIGLQLFWFASTVVTVLTPNYKTVMDSFMKDFQASLHLPETPFSAVDFSHNYGWTVVFGLLIAGAVLGMLVYYRPRFLKEAARAALAS